MWNLAIVPAVVVDDFESYGNLSPDRPFQAWLDGFGYSADDFDWSRQQGATVVPAEDCWYQSLAPLMNEVRDKIGGERPVYLTFDIDFPKIV